MHIEEKNLIDKMAFLRGFALSIEIVFSVFFTKIWLMCIIQECIYLTRFIKIYHIFLSCIQSIHVSPSYRWGKLIHVVYLSLCRMVGNDKWLEAYKDPVASLYTLTQCICLSDVQADGDWKLIIADLGTGSFNMKLKVYKGEGKVHYCVLIAAC